MVDTHRTSPVPFLILLSPLPRKFPTMPGARLPSGALDPSDPKNSFAVLHEKRMAQERVQDNRIAEAYRSGKLKPDRKIPGMLNHNDALMMASAAGGGWTHAERWRPSAEDERERLAREGHGAAAETVGVDEEARREVEAREGAAAERRPGLAERVLADQGTEGKKSVGRRLSRVLFGV
jgi:hypothetical protein